MFTNADIMNSTTQFLGPVLKGLVDATVGIMPGGGGGNNGSKKDYKQGKNMSTKSNGNGNGLFLPFNRNLVRIAGLSGALAVGLGAYGAHVIMVNDKIPENQKHSFKTANMYHFIGTFGLIASSMSSYPKVSGFLMTLGTCVFCGSCYLYGFTGDQSMAKLAPFGGSTLIVAWLSLVL
ncbi:transmembrane protein 256 isoform X2 [Folsomia candida]|uniref:transmembrane protein 256 isoform X2 n=1 Tax=Folsomia candida TaxID=158441 RepID=UPI000B900B59|nr:transmembrane protein 256 isoform X2 [Folsomia candida]